MQIIINERAKWRETGFSTKVNSKDIKELIKKYGVKNLYIHFDSGVPTGRSGQTTPQKSFNPQTAFETPIGIYLYQMEYVVKTFGVGVFDNNSLAEEFPFAAEHKFVYVYLIPEANALKSSDVYKSGIPEKTVYDIHSRFGLEKLIEVINATDLVDGKKFVSEYYKGKVNNPVLQKTGAFKTAVSKLVGEPKEQSARLWFYMVNRLFGSTGNDETGISKVTLYLVRNLGVAAFSDNMDWGIIHENEPTQAVLMDTSKGKIVYVKNNIGNEEEVAKQSATAKKVLAKGSNIKIDPKQLETLILNSPEALGKAINKKDPSPEMLIAVLNVIKTINERKGREFGIPGLQGMIKDLLANKGAPIENLSNECLAQMNAVIKKRKTFMKSLGTYWKFVLWVLAADKRASSEFLQQAYKVVKPLELIGDDEQQMTAEDIAQAIEKNKNFKTSKKLKESYMPNKILEFKLEKLQELAENCGCADLAIIDPIDGSYEEEFEFDTDEWVEGDGIEVDDEFGEFDGNYDEDLADVIDVPDADDDRGLLKKKIMQAISDVLGETAHKDKLHGGKADYVPDYKFNKKELRKGIRHELEHSDDSDIAKETAQDHMMEDPKYYTHLQKHMGQYEKIGKKKIKEQQAALNAQQQGFTWAQLKIELDNIVNNVKQQSRGQVSNAIWKSAIDTLKSQGKGAVASILASGVLYGGASIAGAGALAAAGGATGGLVLAGAGIYGVFKAIKDHKKQALSSQEVRTVVALCGMDYNLSQVVDDKLEDEFFETVLKPYIDQKIRTAPNEKISDISILFSNWINNKTGENGLATSQHKITPPGQPTTTR